MREVVAVDATLSHFIGGADELGAEAGDDSMYLLRVERLECVIPGRRGAHFEELVAYAHGCPCVCGPVSGAFFRESTSILA